MKDVETALYTIEEVSRTTGLSRSFLYARIADRELPVVHFGRAVRVRRDDLERFIDAASMAHKVLSVTGQGDKQ